MNPFDEKHNRRARESLAEQGIEMTPDELQRERKAAYATIREEMKKRGHDVPDSDEELFLLIRESQLTYEERAALDSIDIDAIIREVTGETLEDQNKRHSAAAMKFFKQSCSEKKTRIQYQDIVYQCCNIVDKHNGKQPGQGITIEQLPDAIAAILSERGDVERLSVADWMKLAPQEVVDWLSLATVRNWLREQNHTLFQMSGQYDGAMSDECKQRFREHFKVVSQIITALSASQVKQ